jgi:hypothetical protein
VAVGDFNGDGKLDLAVANQFSDTVSILLGTGTGSFGAKTDFGAGSFPASVAVGDFNGDGNLDLAVANLGHKFHFGIGTPRTVSILLGKGTGSFGAKTEFVSGSGPDPNYLGGPDSVAVGDFNGDGKLDLVVTNLNSNTVSILLNTGAVTPPKITMASVAGKKLIVVGENFNPDAVILINGEEQKTRNDDQNPGTRLIGKKAGKKIKPGDRLQVRNPDGPLSEEFIFTGS